MHQNAYDIRTSDKAYQSELDDLNGIKNDSNWWRLLPGLPYKDIFMCTGEHGKHTHKLKRQESEENKRGEAETIRTGEIESKKRQYSEMIEEGSLEQQPDDIYQPGASGSLPSAKSAV